MEEEGVQEFFKSTTTPVNYSAVVSDMKTFIDNNSKEGRRIVLVTSGGTIVPLESRTVRYLDNFSVGSRGATSADGYGVIFLHRRNSLQPFARQFQHKNLLDIVCINGDHLSVKAEHAELLRRQLTRHNAVSAAGTLLLVEFVTLSEYLHYLQAAAHALAMCGRAAMVYLAAAVSDFYIPASDMVEHKIQSSDGPLTVQLQLVPKMLKPLVFDWAPQAFTISFKLETDPQLLLSKSRQALSTYHHQAVVGNILETRKTEVVVVTEREEKWIRVQNQPGEEIEKIIVDELVQRHSAHISATGF